MLVFWLAGLFVLACTAQHAEPASAPPSPPSLHWLFTAHLDVLPNTAPLIPGPRGVRLDLPITGGTVHGKHGMNGALRLFPLPSLRTLTSRSGRRNDPPALGRLGPR